MPLVYSTNVLTSDLRVEREPTASEPRALVGELLSPHGLALREANGAWLIVRAERAPPPVIAGTVAVTLVAAATGEPIIAALVALDPPNGPSVGVTDGSASFTSIAPGAHVLMVRADGFLPQRRTVDISPGETETLTLALTAEMPKLEELTVTASRYDVRNQSQPSLNYFSRNDIERLSELGNDPLRVLNRLPGTASLGFSSRSHVRGGALDETTVILDGVELVEAYHLRDYQSVFSAIDERVVAGMQFYSGGFPAAYGNALSGLTVIDRANPELPLHHELGLSFLYTTALSGGTFRDGKNQWLVSARRGNLDWLLNDDLGEPAYRDMFAHVGIELSLKHRLGINGFSFDDDIALTLKRDPAHAENGGSYTDNSQFWLNLESDWSDTLSSRTILRSTNFVSQRFGRIDDMDFLVGYAQDDRTLSAVGMRQDWRWSRSDRHVLTWGVDVEALEGEYRYASKAELLGVFATDDGATERALSLSPSGRDYGAYVSGRVRLADNLVADVGLRWDRQTYLPEDDDEQFSPRASLLYNVGASTDLRISMGRFFQSEDLLDLQVEDGVTDYFTPQNASHSIIGVEHRFDAGLSLRLELFRKWTHSARPRYENLFDPMAILPELRPGRVGISPDRADARGLEISVQGGSDVEWWFAYSLARAEDIIGAQRVLRSWDQRHGVSGGVAWDTGLWSLSAIATFHTGWPTTTLSLVDVPGGDGTAQVVVPGELNADRLPATQRVDFRASRAFRTATGSLRFFAEITNLTDRENPCCARYEAVPVGDGRVRLDRDERDGLPLMGNVGIAWEF